MAFILLFAIYIKLDSQRTSKWWLFIFIN
jgi:hypothetical protein